VALINKGNTLNGTCGFNFVVTETNFRFNYNLYFQSYKISIIMLTMLALKDAFPQTKSLLHQHDGVTISISSQFEFDFRLKA
jgi:hypothetical protein